MNLSQRAVAKSLEENKRAREALLDKVEKENRSHLTAAEDRQAMIDALGAGADDFISKSSALDVLKARVRAPASEGEANAALVKLVGEALGVAQGDVVLVAGATARIKRLTILGAAPGLAATLEKIATIR